MTKKEIFDHVCKSRYTGWYRVMLAVEYVEDNLFDVDIKTHEVTITCSERDVDIWVSVDIDKKASVVEALQNLQTLQLL